MRWADDSIGWYRDHVNYHLEEEVLKLEKSGKKCLKVFIPLCGNQERVSDIDKEIDYLR